GWLSLEKVAGLTKRRGKEKYLTDGWIAETRLCRLKSWRHPDGPEALNRELVLVEDMALPALARGWLESRTTLQRHAYDAVTAEGWEALATREEPEDAPGGGSDTEARELYLGLVKDALADLGTAAPEDRKEIGPVPLPVAIEGVLYAS